MPPKGRPSKSPAREKPSPAPKAAPAKKSPAKSPANGRGKSPAKAKPVADPPEPVVPVTTTEAPATEPPAPPAPATIETPKSSPKLKSIIPLGVFGLVVALGVLLSSVMMTDPPKIPKVSEKVFSDKKLNVDGSALIIFSTKECEHCKTLKQLFDTKPFRSMADGWKRGGLLKMGQVNCDKHSEVCERFGVSGDKPSATGYPYIMHFKDGAEVGPFKGERTQEGFKAWVMDKKSAGTL